MQNPFVRITDQFSGVSFLPRAGLGAALLLFAAAAQAQQTLDIATPENAAIVNVASAVLHQAYGRIGVQLKVHALPLRRGVQLADAGELDGDLMHTMPSLKEWPQLLVVRVPVARVVFSAYKLGPDCPASVSAADLSAGRVAYMRGTRAVEEVLPAAALRESSNNLDALRHVQRGITNYAVVGQLESDAMIARYGMRDLCKVAEPVVVTELYHSVNRQHAELAARVEHVLQEMAAQGEIRRIWAREAQRAQNAMLALP